MMRLKPVSALLLGLFVCALPLAAQPDILTISQTFSISANGSTQHLVLSGQNGCTVTFATVGSGASFTVTGSADNVPTPATVTGIGTSGVIATPTAGSTYGGAIAPQALTQLWLVASGLSGTYTGTITCSGSFGGGGGSSGGSVTISNTPLPVTITNAGAVTVLHNLTSASPTTCTSLATSSTTLWFVENANAAAMTATMTLFNDNGTCATADILGTYILGQGQVIFFSQLGKQFGTALSYTLSAAVATGGPVIIGASQ